MTEYVEFTVPSVSGDHELIDPEYREIVEATVIGATAKFCGGATVTEGQGYYYHQDGTLAVEDVTIVKGYVLDAHPSVIRGFAVSTAEYIAEKLNQESAIVSISGNVEFVNGFTAE